MANEFTAEQLKEIGIAQAKEQARANALAPYEILAEVKNWTTGSQFWFTKKTEGLPMEKRLEVFHQMLPSAETALQEAAAEAAAKAAAAPAQKEFFDKIRAESAARQGAEYAKEKKQRERRAQAYFSPRD